MTSWQPTASLSTLKKRAELYATIRHFFAQRQILEVDTPLLAAAGVTDPYVENLTVEITQSDEQTLYLQTSPEYAIKRLLAAGIGDCYQLGKVFREEYEGRQHRREFTMLEWYRIGWSTEQLQQEVLELLCTCGLNTSGCKKKSYREWFIDALELDPIAVSDAELHHAIRFTNIDSPLTRDEMLDLLMHHRIEPVLAQYDIAIIDDFPASRAALAKLDPDNPTLAQRFEIYCRGVELANGYQELTDPTILHQRWQRDTALRQQQGKPERPVDHQLLAAMQSGLPECAGVALGVDRLLMQWLNISDIGHTTL